MVEAKVQHAPVARDERVRKSAKVINLMDALRKSVQHDKSPGAGKKAGHKAAAATSTRGGIALVKPAKAAKRKSA